MILVKSFVFSLSVIYFTLLSCWIVTDANGLTRKLTASHNPGCAPEFCDSVKVLHVSAEGPNDTLHYLWDFTHKPSILVALTPASSHLLIDWINFKDESAKKISFSEKSLYSFGIVLDKLWEYNDVDDTGFLDLKNTSSNYRREFGMQYFNWKIPSNFTVNNTDNVEFVVEASSYSAPSNLTAVVNGSIRIMLSAFGFRDHSGELPHLLHSANCTQVDLILDKLKTDSNFTSSRFAVEVILASSDQNNSSASLVSRKSLDDEHSPGVFTLVDLQTPVAPSGNGGYLQWRPVAYIAKERGLSNSTDTNSYGVLDIKNHTEQLNHTLLYSYYSENLNNLLVQSTTVSFGLKEDGFYKKTNYTSWTFMVGYGTPPNEDFSLLVILVISIGLGLPALLIIVAGIVMAVRRISQKKDDLFLNR
ncbi:glycosylated lysosomal membrane protein B-like [Periplaneta americana]|uniref:glycosylated lysosomal membrane protein B-like n=1 Tax=Periplaneta americana TaxID=6978 RepID=UPI0037E94283